MHTPLIYPKTDVPGCKHPVPVELSRRKLCVVNGKEVFGITLQCPDCGGVILDNTLENNP